MCRRLCTLATSVLVLGSVLVGVAPAGDPTLVGWWKCDDGTGTVARDSSDYGNDGAFNGDPQWVEGYFGGAIEFDGSGDYLDCGDDPSLDLTTWTITFWLNLNENKNYNGYIVKGLDAAENFEVLTYGAGNFHFPILFEDGGRGFSNTENGVSIVGEWSHYTYTYDASEGRRFYKDGVLIFEDTESRVPQTSDEPLIIGNEGGTDRFVPGVMDDIRIYNRVLTAEELADVLLGKGPGSGLAAGPNPENEATDVPRDVPLSWEAGEFAVTHDVYLGTVFEDVNEAGRADDRGMLISQGQTTTTIDPEGVFEYGQTYYWRVDEVNGAPDNTIFKGETWSFTVEPLGYPIENVVATSNGVPQDGADPVNVVNGSGLNANDEHSTDSTDMWLVASTGDEPLFIQFEFDGVYKLHEMLVWNYNVAFELLLGFGLKDVTIEYSENGADWMALGDVTLNQGAANAAYTANTVVDFGGVAAQHVRLTVNSGYGMMGQFGLSEVRFLYVPVQAREPQPEDGAVDVGANADLSWRAGREGVSHEVYLGADPDALELLDTVSTTTVDPGALDLAATYYWRIDEVNDAEAISTWEGKVWNFSTETYIVVEGFESYDDEENRIYQTWVDGYGVDGNGSQVGHLESPFAEQTIVKSGTQSMPLFFDNTGGTALSEAERTLEVPMDWTVHGIKSLSLAFAGDATNTLGQLYVKVNGTKVLYDGAMADLQVSGWLAWTIDLAALGNVSNVTTLTIGIEGAGAQGVLYVDDIRLYPLESEMIEPAEPDAAGLVAHYPLDANFQDASGNGNDAAPVGDVVITNDPTQGGIASFDGLGDGLQVPALDGGTAAEMTISLWINTDIAWSSGFFAVYHNDGWDAGDIHMHISGGGYFTAGVNGLSGGDLASGTMPVIDEWYNVTVTVSTAETALYINGVQEALRIPTAAPETFNLGEGHLGAWLNGANIERALTGQIDEVRFYNRALSYGEVMSLAGRTTPLYRAF